MLIQKTEASFPGPDVDIAWAAGFWDGEGCFLRDHRSDVPSLQVSQAGDEGQALLARFAVAIGAPAAIYLGWRKSENHKPAYKLHITGEAAATAYELCRPYLSRTKINQAENVLTRWRARQAAYVHHSAAKTHCPHGHEYTPENTGHNNQGARICLTCRRARGLAVYYRTKAQAARVEVRQEEADSN